VNHVADVDPIVHPDGSASHTHDFWGNPQTWPGVATNQLVAYEADVSALQLQSGVSQATARATITLPAGVSANPFKVGDAIYVSGVEQTVGVLDPDVNSTTGSIPAKVWTVSAVPNATAVKFQVAVNVSRTDVPGANAALGLSITQPAPVPFPAPP